AINIGWAVGSGLGGFLAKINYELLFWVDGCTNIAAAILMWLFLKPVNYKPSHQAENKIVTQSAYKDKKYLLFILITIFFAGCFFQLFTNLPVFFKRDLHFSEPLIGFLLAANGIVIAIVEMVLVYKLEGKGKNMFYITIGVMMTGLFFLLLNISGIGPAAAFCLIILVTMGEIFALPFMNTFWIGRSQHANRGQYAALYTMAWSAAQTLGPMGGAQLADQHGFSALWWVAGGICMLMSLAFWNLQKFS
ncbi:MAG: MFS transporter, partial [Chitinophagaceae bacterium]